MQVREPSSVLFVVEACHDGEADNPVLAAERTVDAIARALDARARGYGAVVGVRPAARATPGSSPFTRHLLYSLQHPDARDPAGTATVARVVDRLRSDNPEQGQVQSFAFIPGRDDFVVAMMTNPTGGPRSVRPPNSGRAVVAAVERPPFLAASPALAARHRAAHQSGKRRARPGRVGGASRGLHRPRSSFAPESDLEARATTRAHQTTTRRRLTAASDCEKALSVEPGQRVAPSRFTTG